MLINNKIKMALSERKEEKMDIKKLDGEVSPSKHKGKKKREWDTHEIGEVLEISSYRTSRKDSKRIWALLYNEDTDSFRWWWNRFTVKVRIIDKRENKTGREEYAAKIIQVIFDDDKIYYGGQLQEKKAYPENIIGQIVKIQAQ